jgi:hypothetical protein
MMTSPVDELGVGDHEIPVEQRDVAVDPPLLQHFL